MKHVPTNLSNVKTKVDKVDVDKLVPVPADLGKLSDVVKNDVVNKDVYNAKIKNIEDKVPDVTNLVTNASLNAKINDVKPKIPNITNLATTRMDIISWKFLILYQFFFSPQVKRSVIISNKNGIYELSHDLWNDLSFAVL